MRVGQDAQGEASRRRPQAESGEGIEDDEDCEVRDPLGSGQGSRSDPRSSELTLPEPDEEGGSTAQPNMADQELQLNHVLNLCVCV